MSGNIPPYADCRYVDDALAGVSGKNVKGSVDNLSKAYQHAKTCKNCSDALGAFLQDLIKELGVKLPEVNRLEDREPEYTPEESKEKSKEPTGPGTVGWSPKESGAPYQLTPTKASLALTVNELEEKCRRKDAMIQAMADELVHLRKQHGWSPQDLLSQVADAAPACQQLDFDRRALCNYIAEAPLHSLQPPTEEKEFKATNPLSLRITRQIGPDSILVEWDCPPAGKVIAYELFVNGLFAQRVRSSSRTKAILHPVDLSSKIYVTLNAIAYTGDNWEKATVQFP